MHREKKRKSAGPAGGDAARTRRSLGTVRRRRRRRTTYALGTLTAVGVAGALLVAAHGGNGGAAADGESAGAAPAATEPAGTPSERSLSPAERAPASVPSSAPPPGAGGNGVFDTAQASGESVGTGTLRRYKVQVEQGTGVRAADAAREIESILGDRRSWTADGHDAFRLVSGGPYDFEVKIASPDTVDRICGAAGLHTRGEVNCDVGDQVVVNLKRWRTGSPQFPGPLHEYRALIINHEVGHRIGHGHEGCPGAGRPAPAMMQQIDGLHGCVANAWPYDTHGTYLAGPPVP
ncbi:DUF3152 domain-containing protein [Streptomyces sp. CBMA29]|uniref:DUF3152 domain-containing protein n=1 Tax=Streptomyces sp. CBMA29 TaxID=1896314 RepID=UPI001662096F|nr:DUF3152 domain-containing protein [Streptomyces sp. CBMA29]MBD0734689.1 hypothetical protein [Streptomyces sp. CBMA29]